MTDLAITEATYPTVDEIHAQILSDIRYGYSRAGLTANVKKGSDLWHRARGVANRIALGVANNQITARTVNPLRATGDDLIELAKAFGVTKRAATGAIGRIAIEVLSPATSVDIPLGGRATAPNGQAYDVSTAATAATNGQTVSISAVDTGAATDQAAGTILTWDSSAIAYLGPKATVASEGLDGGADEDSEEVLRQRLLRRLAFPMVGGNWSYVANLAEESSASVSVAYVYMSARGPSSYDVAIQGEPDDAELSTAVQSAVSTAIIADMPGSANLSVTTVDEQEIDVIIDIGLPLPAVAGGTGGGWADSVPWPSDAESGSVWPSITSITVASSQIVVASTSADPPVAGNRFGVWIPDDEEFVEFTIASVSGSSGSYTITVDSSDATKLGKLSTDMYCTAWAEYMGEYGTLISEACKLLGPGEKTDDANILKYAKRRPPPDVERPSKLTARELYAITSARSEVSDISFAARFDTTTTTTRTSPSIPSNVAAAPKKLKLVHLAFRRKT